MKRNLSIGLGLLAVALLPAMAQTPAPALKGPTGKIHGHVNGPEGAPRTSGTVSLSSDNGHSSKFSFPVSASGDYAGDATPGTYMLVYRTPTTPADQMVDSIDGVKIVADQDILQNDDMSRKEYIDKMTPEEKKQLAELIEKNKAALGKNAIIKRVNADLLTANQDIKDANGAKDAETKTAKYTEVETLMLKDTADLPDQSVLWVSLGLAQTGLKKYDDAETTYKKVLDLESKAKSPNISVEGSANAGLGEIYARTGKVPEANAAYDAAAKINPTLAAFYLKNEMVVFFQMNNADAQVAAADEVIKTDPTIPIAYYLKGNGLVGKSTVDTKSNKLIAPPGCQEAYQKYLELAPTGQYAADVKSILASLQATLPPQATPGSGKKKKNN
jgi:tetratricopeptide (TPR) repeat protein